MDPYIPGAELVVGQVDIALAVQEVVLLLLGVEDRGDGLLVDGARSL